MSAAHQQLAFEPGVPRPLVLAGPTAVGKTEVSLLLAERLNGEIVTVDSMQVYRWLDIGTAKPTVEEQRGIPHHLIDVVDLTETFDVARFVELAPVVIREVQARGRVPILAGGTGMYIKALFEGFGTAPAPDPALRQELEAAPLEELLKELAERDPATYERIDRQNPRRVVRAVEVIRLSGKPFGEQRALWQHAAELAERPGMPPIFCLNRERAELCQRIADRVEEQFERGVIAETEVALKHGLAQNRTAMQAIVYRQVVEYLAGERSLPDTKELIKARNRQYSKRQATWFRHQARVQWFDVPKGERPTATAERVLAAYRESGGEAGV